MLGRLRLVRRFIVPAGFFASFLFASFLFAAPSLAVDQGTPEQRQACAPDAMRLCSDFIPDVPKITKCMKEKRDQLSEACRRAMAHKPHHYRKKPANSENCGLGYCN
jgi:hypothetical protein